MALAPSDTQRLMLSTIARLMDRFPPDYWKGLEDRESYPEAFVAELEAQGFGGLLIPSDYGGAGGSLGERSAATRWLPQTLQHVVGERNEQRASRSGVGLPDWACTARDPKTARAAATTRLRFTVLFRFGTRRRAAP